jgi:hypothetical protein
MKEFLSTLPRRQIILGAVALVLAILLFARWIADWGLVTIHAKDQPLSKVIASIARQGGVRVESSLDPTKLVTMDVVKVTPVEALETLAGVTDAGWRVVYLAAPTKIAINEAIISLKGTGKIENWDTSYYPGGGWGAEYGQAIDPRTLDVTMEGAEPDLGKLLDEAAQKSGVMTALPKDWTPSAKLPKPTNVRNAVISLVGSAHGNVTEFFFLSERRPGWSGSEGLGGGPGDGEGGPDGFGGPRSSNPVGQANGPMPPAALAASLASGNNALGPNAVRSRVKPHWIEQRQKARIKKLPTAEQLEAKKDGEERKAFFTSLQGLSAEERTAKIQDMLANSEMGQKMHDQRLVQDAKQSAERRISRAVNYIKRKASAKAAGK